MQPKKFDKFLNDVLIYSWRFIVLMLITVLGFMGSRLYTQVDQISNFISTEVVCWKDIEPVRKDIRELRAEIRELNGYLLNMEGNKK